jgi:Smg protein
MIDVLVYLFEHYYQSDAYPDHDTLARKLTAAGFENEDINDALSWLEGLAQAGDMPLPEHFDAGSSFRTFTSYELSKLSVESRGFLAFLESAQVLSPSGRELAIDRAMALADDVVELDKMKIIVLMVLWTRQGDVDTLVLEELLPDPTQRHVH